MKKTPKLGRAKRRERYVGRVVLSGEHLYTKADWGPNVSQPSPECLKDYLDLLEAWERRGHQPRCKARLPQDPKSMGALVDIYEAHLQDLGRYVADGQETTTWRFIRPCLESFRDSFGAVPIRNLTKAHLTSYRNAQERLVAQAKMMPRNANRRLARLREFIIWAIQLGHLPETLGWTADHLPKVERHLHHDVIQARSHSKRAVTWEEVNAVAEVCSDVYSAMLKVHRMIGCRPGELCAMDSREIEVQGEWWKWSPRKTKTAHHGHKTVYWIGPEAQEILKPWVNSGKVWPNEPTTMNYLEAVESACKRTGVARFTPHELRHAVATERANDPSIPLAAASRSIGHVRVTSLQPYVHEDEEQIRRASRVS